MKAYTDVEQSMKLDKILPKNSYDMYLSRLDDGRTYIPHFSKSVAIDKNLFSYRKGLIVPCWSLDALMELLPETVTVMDKEDEEDYTDYILCIIKEDGQWTIYYEEEAHSALTTEWLVDKTSENLIDAAYNVIVELHSRELL